MARNQLKRARRLLIKLGTTLLTTKEGGIAEARFASFAEEVAGLLSAGYEIVVVSSGAVGLGVRRLKQAGRPQAIPEIQAAAAIGQIELCQRFERAFAEQKRLVGQLLLTHGGLADRERFLNARRTLEALLEKGAVPIINENDSVATEELRFGDNDQLAAMVVNCCSADLLVLLTDVAGLYDRDPRDPHAQRISEVAEVDAQILAMAAPKLSSLSRGGMSSKLEAARLAARSGVPTLIADGKEPGIVRRLLDGEDLGTLVHPADQKLSSRKHWIASLKPRGSLSLDDGAVRALLEGGRSLLPIGIVAIDGDFGVGDAVRCVSPSGKEIARGLCSYNARELQRIQGQRTPRILELLGYSNGDAAIHRDDLVLR